jgi:hypothetical protein
MTNTPPNSKGNNAMLTQACEAAYTQFKEQLATLRSQFQENPDAQNSFNETEAFLDPLFSELCEDMNAAEGIEEQKELLLQMMRSSFNEVMMVSGDKNTATAVNYFIVNASHNYSQQLRNQGVNVAKFGKSGDPAGTFQAVNDYINCQNIVASEVNRMPAQELRQKYKIPAGPVTPEQRSMLLKESEAILRHLGEPLIDADKPFQPDMLAPVLMLMMDSQHIREMIQGRGAPKNENALPSATVEKWNRLQRDYPDMATNVGTLINATIAAKGRGRSSLN